MPVVHIVLVKVKQSVLSNGFDELKQKCETLKDLPIAKSKATEIKWGPPEYPGRNEGYNWGESRTAVAHLCMQRCHSERCSRRCLLILALSCLPFSFTRSADTPTIRRANRSIQRLCFA